MKRGKLMLGRGECECISVIVTNAQCMHTRVTVVSLFVSLSVGNHSSASVRRVCNKLNLPARSLLHSK